MGRIVYRRTLLRSHVRSTRFLSLMSGVNLVFKKQIRFSLPLRVSAASSRHLHCDQRCVFMPIWLIPSSGFAVSYHTVPYRIVL